jgi:alanyl-tRNA synthetase
MPTEKLYWDDPFATSFEAAGAAASSFQGRPSVVLPRTLFYPEAGGQLGDAGVFHAGGRDVVVCDTQIDDAGSIHHVVESDDAAASLAAVGALRGEIDAARRRDQMAQHTAQHALSRALVDVAGAATVSARLGKQTSTIDVDVASIDDAAVAKAEDLVNAVVMDDVVVRALFPTEAELAAMDLRRAPKVSANVRIVEIAGFDLTPCGGTHCTRSGQIGSVRVVGLERYKGKMRVTFLAGRRAIDDARAKQQVLDALAREMSCGPLDVPAGVAKLRAELKASQSAMGTARGELLGLLADHLLARRAPDPSGVTFVVVRREHDDVAALRALAGRLAARADVVAVCYAPEPPPGAGAHVVVQRGASVASFDCGAWLKGACARVGGRGGGRPDRAEGRLDTAEIPLPERGT